MEKILIIRLSAIGDVLFTLPTMAALLKAENRNTVSWVVEDKAAALLAERSDLAGIFVYPRNRIRRCLKNPLLWPALILLLFKYVQQLRRVRYDRVYDFQGNLKSGIHLFAVRGRRKIGFAKGYAKEGSHVFCGEKVVPPSRAVHRVERAFSLAFPDFRREEICRPDLEIPESIADKTARTIERLFPETKRFVVMHPGTSLFGIFKRWPAEKFGRLATRLLAEHGTPTLVTWGPEEAGLAEKAAAASGGAALVAPRTESILGLAGLIRCGSLFVAADSGPLHMANLQGVPCVALFGPKDPAIYRPYFAPAAVVSTNVDCSPCPRRRCDDPVCMTGMTVEMVFRAASRLLAGGG
jgi:heptosyltransferase I